MRSPDRDGLDPKPSLVSIVTLDVTAGRYPPCVPACNRDRPKEGPMATKLSPDTPAFILSNGQPIAPAAVEADLCARVTRCEAALEDAAWELARFYSAAGRQGDATDCVTRLLAGTADRVVPYEQSLRLYEAAPGLKRLVTFEGADHNDPILTFGARLLDETTRFLADTIASAAPDA